MWNKILSLYQRNAARRMFSSWAQSYEVDVLDNHYSAADRVAQEALRHLGTAEIKEPVIIDAGIGTGLLSAQIKDAYPCHITGLDFNADMLSLCMQKEIADLLVLCDVGRDHWPAPDNSSDMVVSAGLFEYLSPPMATHATREALRTLKTGGIFIFAYMPRKADEKQTILWRGYSGTFMIFSYTEDQMVQMVTSNGFNIVQHVKAFKGSIYEDGTSYDYRLIIARKT